MSDITLSLAKALGTVTRPGDFYAVGRIDALAPSIEVEGVGRIALPVLAGQAAVLVAAAERAPFGRGPETLIDTAVRRTWQFDAARVQIGGKHWPETLGRLVAAAAEGLGVEPALVEAEFYKLLVYDEGSFFVGHRDTEKSPGMFGTLVVAVPSVSRGGDLLVRHKGRDVRLDLKSDDPAEWAYAAFYADCIHEVLPITSGCRLTLVYNLLRRGPDRSPEPPNYAGERDDVAHVLRGFSASLAALPTGAAPSRAAEADDREDEGLFDDDDDDDDVAEDDDEPDDDTPTDQHPRKLVYPLEHAYTEAELDFGALKGADAAVASVLLAAAAVTDFDLFLARVEIFESGGAEYSGSYRGGRWGAAEAFEAGDVDDRVSLLKALRRSDGTSFGLDDLPILPGEVCPPEAFDALIPDEEQFEEATGNAGATFERTYRRAAIVLWPRRVTFDVLCQAGLDDALSYLEGLVARCADAGPAGEARDLVDSMIRHWPSAVWDRRHQRAPGPVARMLCCLDGLQDAGRIAAFLTIIPPTSFETEDVDAAIAAFPRLDADVRAQLTESIIGRTSLTSFAACAALLDRLVAATEPARRALLRPAARALVAALPNAPEPSGLPSYGTARPARATAAGVEAVLRAAGRVDPALAEQAAGTIVSRGGAYGADEILVPAVRALWADPDAHRSKAVLRLPAACLVHLRARIAEPLAAPTDWRRAGALRCQCPDCMALSAFLDDPGRREWTLRAPEARRGHVESTIRTARSDLHCETLRQGRPYGLVCTKTQASYERRVAQRTDDRAALDAIGG